MCSDNVDYFNEAKKCSGQVRTWLRTHWMAAAPFSHEVRVESGAAVKSALC